MRTRILGSLILVLLLIGCSGGGDDAGRPARSSTERFPVILIGLDTVRNDHLQMAGHPTVRTPSLAALAEDGVYFSACQSTAPWTGPSFASIFTGLLPYHHGFLGGKYGRLAEERETLAEILNRKLFPTAMFYTIHWLRNFYGMTQGFDRSLQLAPGAEGPNAANVTRHGLEFVDKHSAGNFFLFLHYFDAHAPYDPPAPFGRMYYEGDERAPGEPLTEFLKSDRNKILAPVANSGMYDWLEGVTDPDFPPRQYEAGVSFVDHHVGLVVQGLKERGLYDKSMIIVVSDHGEHLGEHDLWYTHAMPYEEALRVPLVIKFPEGRLAGEVRTDRVSILDILPTILAEQGLRIPEGLDGRDLAAGEADTTRSLLVAEHGSNPNRYFKTLVDGRWKLFLSVEDSGSTVRLFDLETDPGELTDVADAHPDVVRRLSTRLAQACAGTNGLAGVEPVASKRVNKTVKTQLKSLGYVH